MQTIDQARTTSGVTAAHRALAAALLAKDEPALQQLVSDRCRIIGPKGFQISKQDWIRPHVDDVYELLGLQVLESEIETHEGSAVVVELQESACLFQGERIEGLFRVTTVWHHHAGWQVVALQYTAVSPETRP